ncbi:MULTISPECIES: NAD(P)H-dependent amine dehydrogenase family protein [Nocardia]|uniref:NAD(P)H-dependent amine dehydrogenase family protein n=1 Tax=Nocardia abscessus TaxID=120957 RepID=UPI001893A917|nr:diacylglycerol kinase [Nocardia abscessus]MBF6472235.1 diacylglycerol kinase [Nocardia abscessus]
MTYRVVQWGTGNVGRHALAGVIAHPELELTGVWVSGPAKSGADAGTLAGLDHPVGVAATMDADALLASRPDCVVYCSMTDNRLLEAVQDLQRILAAGINVVACAPVFFQYPYGVLPDELLKPVQEAAAQGNSSLWVNGIDPGFANDLLPLALAGTCLRVDQVRCLEIVDYASYDNRAVMFDIMGFGKPVDEIPMLLQPGVLSLAWGGTVRQLAAGIGVTLDAVTQSYERIPAPESFDIATGHIAEGTAAALRFEVRGMVGGVPVTVLEHVTRLRPDLCPDWPQPAHPEGSYRVEITGEPDYALDLVTSSRNGDHNYATVLATGLRIVNAVPAVIAAPAGILTALDLPLITAPAHRPGR